MTEHLECECCDVRLPSVVKLKGLGYFCEGCRGLCLGIDLDMQNPGYRGEHKLARQPQRRVRHRRAVRPPRAPAHHGRDMNDPLHEQIARDAKRAAGFAAALAKLVAHKGGTLVLTNGEAVALKDALRLLASDAKPRGAPAGVQGALRDDEPLLADEGHH